MGYTPLLIGPISDGLRKDLQPFLLPEDAFPALENAYQFRGSIYKKGGNTLLSRLGIRREDLATRGAGVTNVNVALHYPPIEPGSIIITDGVTTFTDNGIGGFVIAGGNGVVNAPTNYVTGQINITFNDANPGAHIIATYYVAIDAHSPVMGLRTLDLANSVQTVLMAFDTQMSYRFDNITQQFAHIRYYRTVQNDVVWTGLDTDFFYSANYQDAFFATNNVSGGHFYTITNITKAANATITIGAHNFVNGDQILVTNVTGMTQINGLVGTVTGTAALTITVNINSAAFGVYTGGGICFSPYKSKAASGDGIRWYDNDAATNGWVNFSPPLDLSPVPNILQGALMIIPYHERLVCLNTVEGTTYATNQRFAQRARWSQIGSCFQGNIAPTGSVADNNFNQWQSTPGGPGGFVDAPTNEEIISAALIKDTLMVFFERSTWILSFSGHPALPFYWQKVNSERGSEATFSSIGFDNEVMTVGSNAIVACNPQGVERSDLKIPDNVFSMSNNGFNYKRIYGIRDYYNEFVYWSYLDIDTPDNSPLSNFQNRLLIYNYNEGTWALFFDYYTCFGYYTSTNLPIWGGMAVPWGAVNLAWGAPGVNFGKPVIVGGNSQGMVHVVKDIARDDFPVINQLTYKIQNITNALPSVFTVTNHAFENGDLIFISNVNGVVGINNNIYRVANVAVNQFTVTDINGNDLQFAGYTWGGNVTPVDQFNISTKKFNPTLSVGKKTRVGYIDLFLENTEPNGQITLKLFIDDDDVNPAIIVPIDTFDAINPDNVKFWRRIYVNQVGQTFQVQLTYSDPQIFDPQLIDNVHVLYSFIIWTQDAGRLI